MTMLLRNTEVVVVLFVVDLFAVILLHPNLASVLNHPRSEILFQRDKTGRGGRGCRHRRTR